MTDDKFFDLEIFLNTRLLRNFYTHKYPPIEERVTQTEEKRERWLKEKIFRIKENVLYNNLDSKYLSDLNLNLSNVFYFKHYLKTINDFDSVDFDHIQKMRMNYLKPFFVYMKSEEAINKSCDILLKNEKLFIQYLESSQMKSKVDDLIPLISSLISVLLTENFDEKILIRLLENIILSAMKTYTNECYENSIHVEKNLLILFETFDRRLFSIKNKDEPKDRFNDPDKKLLHLAICAKVINKLIMISLSVGSFPLLILNLLKCKELKLALNNYNNVIKKYLKPKRNLISINKKNVFQNFNFPFNSNTDNILISAISDANFIFLLILQHDQKRGDVDRNIRLYKIGSGFNNTLINKTYIEKGFTWEFTTNNNESGTDIVRFINNEARNELIILITNTKVQYIRIMTINKDNFNNTNQYEIYFRACVVNVFNSDKNIYVLSSQTNSNSTDTSLNKLALFEINLNNFDLPITKLENVLPKDLQILMDSSLNLKDKTQNYLTYFNKNIYLIDTDGTLNATNNKLMSIKLPKFKCEFISGKDIDPLNLIKADSYFYNKDHNYTIAANIKDNNTIVFELYYNTESLPFIEIKKFNKEIKNSKKKLDEILSLMNKNDSLVAMNNSYSNSLSNNINKNVTNILIRKQQVSIYNNSFGIEEFYYIYDEKVSQFYFDLLYSCLAKYISIYGNLKNSAKKYIDYCKNPSSYDITYNKSLNNNFSQDVIEIIWTKSLKMSNGNISDNELYCNLIFLKAYINNILDINIDLNQYLSDHIKNVFDFIFNIVISPTRLNDKIYKEAIDIVSILLKNSNIVKDNPDSEYISKLFKIVNSSGTEAESKENQKGMIDTKLIFLNLILSYYDKIKIDLNLVENIIKFELEIIYSLSTLSEETHYVSGFEFIANFKKIFFKSFLDDICEVDLKDENSIVTCIFDLVVENLTSLLRSKLFQSASEKGKSNPLQQYLNTYSFLTHVLLFYINIITTKSELDLNITNTSSLFRLEIFPFKYFEKIINIIILLDKLTISSNLTGTGEETTYNNIKEKVYYFETEHPCESDQKRAIYFNFNENENIKFKFESLSDMSSNNKEGKTSLEITTGNAINSVNSGSSDSKGTIIQFGPYSRNFPTEELRQEEAVSLIMKYEPNNEEKDNSSYGFRFKCSNSNDKTNSDQYDIITDIRRSLIYSICRLIQNTLVNSRCFNEKETQIESNINNNSNKSDFFKKEKNLYKALFSSKLLDNISILKMKDLRRTHSAQNVHNDYYKDLEAAILSITDPTIKQNCFKYLKEYYTTNTTTNNIPTTTELINSDKKKQINSIINGMLENSTEYYKKGIILLQKFFLVKNIWGRIGGKEIEHLVIFLFTIIIKHEKLVFKYNEYLEHINTEGVYEGINSSNVHEIVNFGFFIRVFTECSKIRVWFSEKKMHIAENIANRPSFNNEKLVMIDYTNTDDEIDLAIAKYIIKITKKAEFLLEALNVNFEEESSKKMDSVSPRNKNKEFTIHNQDLINNLLIYIKTDEVEIDKIVDKISIQNEKAVKKETALILYNMLLTLNKNQQDLRDVLYWINTTFKKNEDENNSSSSCSSSMVNNIVYFNNDISGADSAYIEKVKIQFYNFITILMSRIYVNGSLNLEKSPVESLTHLVLAQSLIWKIKKRDYIFLKSSNFFDIFEKNSIFSNILSTNFNANQSKNNEDELSYTINKENRITPHSKEESQYGKECIDFNYLQNVLFNVLSIYSLQVFDKLNDEVITAIETPLKPPSSSSNSMTQLISPRGATALLSFMRKRSEINEHESFKIIDKISDLILSEFESYLDRMREIIDPYIHVADHLPVINEDKLNSYLSLLYRGLSFNNILIDHFMKRNSDFFGILLEIFLLASDKNKYFIVKFIHMFTIFSFEDEFFNTSIDIFRSSLERRFPDLFTFINSSNDSSSEQISNTQFYVRFLIKLIIALINNETNPKYQLFFHSESDRELAWEIIEYVRVILKLSLFKSENMKKIKEEFIELIKKSIRGEDKNEKNVVLIILGAEFNPMRVGSRVLVNSGISSSTLSENKKNELKNIHQFDINTDSFDSEEFIFGNKREQHIGVVLGFTDNAKNPFVIDETISEFSFDAFSFSPVKAYALVVLEENLTRENIKTAAYDTFILETEELVYYEENKVLNEVIAENELLRILISDVISEAGSYNAENGSQTYLNLKLLKNILFSNHTNLINKLEELLVENNQFEMLIQTLSAYSLSALELQYYQSSLETLEKKSIKDILILDESLNVNSNKSNNSKDKKEKENTSTSETENFISISAEYKSIFVKFNNNLIREIPLLKMFYSNLNSLHFLNNYNNIIKYTPHFLNNIDSQSKGQILLIDSADLTSEFVDFSLEASKIIAIVTNEQFINKNEFIAKSVNQIKLPIICISDTDYYSCVSFLFDKVGNEEFEELFLQSIQRDFSSFIDIPPMMVDETVRFGQRDLVLKILNEEVNTNTNTSNNTDNNTTTSITGIHTNTNNSIVQRTVTKLIALISRRILIFVLSKFPGKSKTYMNSDLFMKIFKLLLFENSLIIIEGQNKNSPLNNEIVSLIKFFINGLKITNTEFDLLIASHILDLHFINKRNYIDFNLVHKVDYEGHLLGFENIENNLKIIFPTLKVLKRAYNKDYTIIKDYEMRLFHAMIIKIDDFLVKNKETGGFILEVLMTLLQQIYEAFTIRNEESMKLTVSNYTFLFRSEEFLRVANRTKDLFDVKLNKIEKLESKILNFFIVFLDLAMLLLTHYDIDLNLDYFINTKIMNLYFAYSLLTKKFKSIEFFILFCQMRDINIADKHNSLNHTIKYDFYHRDKNYESAHLMKFQFEKADGVTIKITPNKINHNLDIDPNSLIFIYNDKECLALQDYFKIDDTDKEIYIKNSYGNKFFISFPYKDFNHSLFGSGSNENQSLGCNGESGKYYGVPQKAQGITSNLIKNFKFGYYHCFVATTDDKLFVCGKDYASSLKDLQEYPAYTLESHFNDIVQREGIVNIWVNNYNATLMLTKLGKLYGCGVNTDGCLGNGFAINQSTNTPFELVPPGDTLNNNNNNNNKIKFVSCGFKTSMLIMQDGTAYTMGCNSYNETGNMETTSIIRDYYHLIPPGNILDVVAGENFFLLLIKESNGKVRLYSMGSNENGRCGVDIDNSHKLQKCKGVENLEFRLVASRNLSCAAVSTKGYFYTFGSNENGNLGHGTDHNEYTRPTLVESLKDYIVDDVSISHNHMLVVCRDRLSGHKHIFGSGTNQYGSLCFEDLSIKCNVPKKINYFKEKLPKSMPVKVATSRYQSYILTLDSKISEDKCGFSFECKACNAAINDVMYIRPVKSIVVLASVSANDESKTKMIQDDSLEKNSTLIDLEFICENCVTTKIGSEIVYMINTPSKHFKGLIPGLLLQSKDIIACLTSGTNQDVVPNATGLLYLDSDTFQHNETNQHFSYQCIDCFIPINNKVFISTENKDLILCAKCIASCSNKIEYPQVFYAMNKLRIDNTSMRCKLPFVELSSCLWNIERAKPNEPYFSVEITPNPSQIEELRQVSKEKGMFKLFNKWKQMSNDHLVELNLLKDEIDSVSVTKDTSGTTEKSLTSASENSKIIKYLQSTEEEKYPLLKKIDEEEFTLLNELSGSINECIFYMMNLTYNIKEKGFMHTAITDNLSLVTSKARLNIFHERINKLKVNVNSNEKEIAINRMKAMRFYEKKIIDSTSEFTIFGQLYHKMKKFPITNYLCKKDNRLFVANLTGEGATDYGGPYRDVFSTACEELHSVYLELFIKSPNNRNEIGAMRDKYICNPNAKSAMLVDMYAFIGCLIGYAISSGHLLNLNIHPFVWKLILNHKVDFSEYETIDKLFYKYINEISKFKSDQKEFETIFDQFFMIQLSDGSEYELIPNGKKTVVTVENKEKFVTLAKTARLNELQVQVESIRYGLINVIDDNILSVLTGKDVEELACGEPTVNLEILKKYTEYQNYTANDNIVKLFWQVLENFTNEERVSYLKYVWGRSRLPDPNIFPFQHVITKISHGSPDTRLPAATTCYFTLKLPAYSSLEVMTAKLKYVIANCAEIDADFAVANSPELEI